MTELSGSLHEILGHPIGLGAGSGPKTLDLGGLLQEVGQLLTQRPGDLLPTDLRQNGAPMPDVIFESF